MRLRKLEKRDAPLMLEWMHDDNVVHYMMKDFKGMTLEGCERFIAESATDRENLHLAVADDNDEYMGTVSLKHIADGVDGKTAEFAICMRTAAMGKGFAGDAMRGILRLGFEKLGLKFIYWSVNPESGRAVRFYEKNGFRQVDVARISVAGGYSEEEKSRFRWYQVEREAFVSGQRMEQAE